MKKAAWLILIFLTSANFVFSKQNERSTIRISLSDGAPLMVTINGRDFRKTGRVLTIGDIPRKRQDMQVYRFRPYADGKGGKAELVYSGIIKLEKGSTYDCIVDIGTRKFRMRKVNQLAPITQKNDFAPGRNQAASPGQSQGEGDELSLPPDRTVSSRLLPLKTAMDKEDADGKKVTEAIRFTKEHGVNTQEVKTIASWIFFDDNRLTFVKAAYPLVSDKSNYNTIISVFTLVDSRKDFEQFLKKQ